MRQMTMTTATPPPAAVKSLPLRVPLPDAPDTFGLSRSAIYRAAAAGHIRMSKLGRSTLVDTASVLDYLDALPSFKPNA